MSHQEDHHTIVRTLPVAFRDGCVHDSARESLKFRLRSGLGLSQIEFPRKVLQLLQDESEPFADRVFAIQSAGRIRSADTETALLRILEKDDLRLSYPALKSLAYTGGEKAFAALTGLRTPLKSLERQRDFARVLIGYRLGLPGTEAALARLLRPAHTAPARREEFRMRFETLKQKELAEVLKQLPPADPGNALSRELAFEVAVAGQRYYFVFGDQFDKPGAWEALLRTRQVAGQLLLKERHAARVSRQYVALATPGPDGVQVSFFRRSGELFMLARVAYDEKNKSFVVSNPREDRPGNAESREFRLGPNRSLIMNLSYIRRQDKRKAEPIRTAPGAPLTD